MKSKYAASFIAAALLFPEYLKMKDILLSPSFLALIEQEVEDNQYLSIKTRSARQRTVQEIKKRCAMADAAFWAFFFSRNEAEQKLALLFLYLKTYPLIMDFHVEVALRKWKMLSPNIDVFDLQMRLDEISSSHPEVDAWSDSTKKKTITVYLRTITEAGLLKKGRLQKPSDINPDFWTFFINAGEFWFPDACFSSVS